jgi:O-antigen/teichoic acid export membrane protein
MNNLWGNFLPIIKNTGSTVFIRGLFGVARIVVLLLIARQFGPSEFGRLSLVLSMVEIFKVMADFGLDTVSIRRFSVNRLLSERILRNALTLKLISATIAYAAANVCFWFMYSNTEGLVLLLIISISIYSTLLANAFVSYFQAKLTVSYVISSNIVSTAVYILLTIACLYLHYPLVAFAVIIPLSEALNLLLTARVYRGISPLRLDFHKKIVFSLLKESYPVGIAGLIIVLYMRMDNLMIGWFVGESGVGEYAAAYRLTEPFFLIFSSLSLSLFAYFSTLRNAADEQKAKQALISIMVPLIALSMVIAGAVFVFSRSITGFLPGKYQTSLGVLMILSLLIVFRAVNPQLTAFINSRGKYGLVTAIASANLLINVLLNLVLVPRYGVNGAATAVVVTEFINAVFQSACIVSILRFPKRRLAP